MPSRQSRNTQKALLSSLVRYFGETPKEKLDKEWDDIKELNFIGPDVLEYEKYYKNVRNSDSHRRKDSKI
jgi:hypothetical protein